MYLLMEKQHNRGQDGAGLANIKLGRSLRASVTSPHSSVDSRPIQDVFSHIMPRFEGLSSEQVKDSQFLQEEMAFYRGIFFGPPAVRHLRQNQVENCHPFLRQNNWRTRNLVVAGNFNMTNTDELFDKLVGLGQHPKEKADTVTILERIGHFVDVENQRLFDQYKQEGLANEDISGRIAEEIDLPTVLKHAANSLDGGYVMCGMIGHGDAFVMRDPNGIRPAFFYEDDEVVVITSERPVIQTAFNVSTEEVHEIQPGHALIIKRDGTVSMPQVKQPGERKACSFERIYFSRGNDQDIYNERKELGRQLVPQIMEAIEHDLTTPSRVSFPIRRKPASTVWSKALRTTEPAISRIIGLGANPDPNEVKSILDERARVKDRHQGREVADFHH